MQRTGAFLQVVNPPVSPFGRSPTTNIVPYHITSPSPQNTFDCRHTSFTLTLGPFAGDHPFPKLLLDLELVGEPT